MSENNMEKIKEALEPIVVEELARANEKFPQFASGHEGYAVIKEEVEEAIRILAEENARLKAQLDSAQREINEVRRQVMMAEMQACGYLPVYQEDGSVEFVLACQLKEPVEM